MIAAIKSEFRKLLSVRSTYFIVLIALAIVALFAGFGDGFRADAFHLRDPNLLASESSNAVVFAGLILAFAGLLLVGHEYRYNTIMYTLTSANRRIKVMLAKFAVITAFALVTGVILVFFSPFCTVIGTHLAHKHLVAQTFHVWPILWHCLFCVWGYAMYAFILITVLRSQVGAIVTFLLIPLIGENILGGIFKSIPQYLPFTAVQAVAAPTNLGNHTTSGHEMVVVLVYLAIGALVSSILFTRRDAN
jgi:ABC-type transport system involved in multi-copper enzyme maturation permease subunit